MSGSTQKSWPRILAWAIIIPGFIALQIAILLAGFLLGAYGYFARNLPTVGDLGRYEPKVPVSSYQEVGSRAPKFMVDMDRVPSHVINAFLAAEDTSFLKREPASLTKNPYCFLRLHLRLYPMPGCFGPGRFTYFVARSFLFTAQYGRGERHIKQIILATRLERTWGRKKVLWVYLNQVYLGKGCYGVGEAADYYFGKQVEELSVAEAALIAGLSASPVRYNPMRYPDKANERKRHILRTMMDHGFLSSDEFEKAKQEPLQYMKH